MNAYEEKLAPIFSHILSQRESEQSEIMRQAVERFSSSDVSSARPAQEYVRFERAANELRELWKAQRRIKDKTYGQCVECKLPIDLLRLSALPTRTQCFGCEKKVRSKRWG